MKIMEDLDSHEAPANLDAFDKIYKEAKRVYKSLEKSIEEKNPANKPKKFTAECLKLKNLPKVGIRDNTMLSLDYIEKK
jgi:hypothetical protein